MAATQKSQRPDLTPAIAFIDALPTLDFYNLALISAALKRRRPEVERPKISAAELRAFYKPGDQGYVIDISDETMAGQLATVESVESSSLIVTIAGRRQRLATSQFAPLPRGTKPTTIAPEQAPLRVGDAVRTVPGGKYGDLRAVVVSVRKKIRLFTLDRYLDLSSTTALVVPDTKPTPNPNLLITYKNEAEKFGPVRLWDTSIIDPMKMRPITDDDETTPGLTDFGWLDRDVAKALSIYYGCRFEET